MAQTDRMLAASIRWAGTAAVVAAITSFSNRGRADTNEAQVADDDPYPRAALIVHLGMLYGAVRADEAKLHTFQAVPAPLDGKDLRLDGEGTMMGGTLGVSCLLKGFRLGVVESFSGVSGLRLLHAPIDGYTLEANAWRFAIEMSIGHQFKVGKLSPYADVRGGVSMLTTTVKLVDPTVGVLGSTNYTAWAPVIGPRVGVLVPVAKNVVVDAAITYGLIGHDAVGLSIGMGFAPLG
jgi:hypothetical protein